MNSTAHFRDYFHDSLRLGTCTRRYSPPCTNDDDEYACPPWQPTSLLPSMAARGSAAMAVWKARNTSWRKHLFTAIEAYRPSMDSSIPGARITLVSVLFTSRSLPIIRTLPCPPVNAPRGFGAWGDGYPLVAPSLTFSHAQSRKTISIIEGERR